ncbi:hypothetical protein [Modestobacter sp. SSW1-42]|uniref:hypothetical protein n=1 Tax=Modestobacter sp. SSW1-42 TaxID=596372 RepID=UPI003987244E
MDTLTSRVGGYANALTVIRARLEAMAEIRAELGDLADELAFLAPDQAEADRRASDESARLRDEARADTSALSRRLADVQRAAGLQALLQDADFQQRSAELSAAISANAQARARAAQLDVVVEAAIEKLDAGTKGQRLIAAAERRLNSLLRKRNTRLARLNDLRERWDVLPSDPAEGLTAEVVAEVSSSAEAATQAQRDAQRRLQQSRMTDSQRQLHSELLLILDDAIRSGLQDFAILHLPDRDVTVGQLAAGIVAPTSPDQVASEEVAAAEQRATELSEAVQLLQEQLAFGGEVADVRKQLAELRASTPDQDELQAGVSTARDQRDAAAQEALLLTQRIGRLQSEGVTEEGAAAAARDLATILRDESIGEADLQSRLAEVSVEVQQASARFQRAQTSLAEIEERQTRRAINRRSFELRASSDISLKWLTAPDLGSPTLESNPEAWWRMASHRAQAFSQRLDALVTAVAGLEYAAQSKNRSAYRDAIDAMVERDALADFADAAIREALFEGGTPVAVDLQRGTITWDTPTGSRREKPLSTFSSGEQALGFIRARLRQLADSAVGDRIVFLDEFGAFLAADRRHPLAELLRGDELSNLSDQVVIVLPLQVDYRAQLGEVTGALKTTYERRADSVDRHGYFTEVFDA